MRFMYIGSMYMVWTYLHTMRVFQWSMHVNIPYHMECLGITIDEYDDGDDGCGSRSPRDLT